MEAITIKMLKDKGRTVLIINGADRERDEAAFRIVSAYMSSPSAAIQEADVPVMQEPTPQSAQSPSEFKPVVSAEAPIEVKGLEPVGMPEEQMPDDEAISHMEDYADYRRRGTHCISSGTYTGLTPYEALQRDNEIALVGLFSLCGSMDPCEERTEIIGACKQYMVGLPGLADELYPYREDRIRFIKNTSEMAPISQFINGYTDVYSFCTGATDAEINNVFNNLVWHFADRGCVA